MPVGPEGYDRQLQIAGDHRTHSGTGSSHGRQAQMAEDQQVVENQIAEHGRKAGDHGDHGFAAFPQGGGVSAAEGKGKQTPKHDKQIFFAEGQDPGGIGGRSFTGEEQPNQRLIPQGKGGDEQNAEQDACQHLETQGVAHTLLVIAAEVLRGEDTGTGTHTESHQIEHKQQLIDDGNTTHGQGTQLTHHQIIQQRHEVCDHILQKDWHCDPQYPAIKLSVTNE